MSELLDLDLASAAPIQSFEEATSACVDTDDAGVESWNLARIAATRGPRSAASLSADEVLSLGYSLIAVLTAPDPPKLFQTCLAARAAGGDAADIEKRMKRATLKEVVEYLWRCEDHGELRVEQGFLVLSSAHPETRMSPPPAGASSGEGSSVARGGAGTAGPPTGRSSKRPIDVLDDSISELADAPSMADAQDTHGDERLHGPLPRPLTYVSSQDKFKASLSTLLTTAGACKQLERLFEGQVTSLVQDIRRILAELVRLPSVDTSLSRERVFVANLEAGVEHSMLGGRADVAAMFVHDELMSTSEEGRRVNMSEVVKKLFNITKFLQGPKGSGRAAIP